MLNEVPGCVLNVHLDVLGLAVKDRDQVLAPEVMRLLLRGAADQPEDDLRRIEEVPMRDAYEATSPDDSDWTSAPMRPGSEPHPARMRQRRIKKKERRAMHAQPSAE